MRAYVAPILLFAIVSSQAAWALLPLPRAACQAGYTSLGSVGGQGFCVKSGGPAPACAAGPRTGLLCTVANSVGAIRPVSVPTCPAPSGPVVTLSSTDEVSLQYFNQSGEHGDTGGGRTADSILLNGTGTGGPIFLKSGAAECAAASYLIPRP
jgi:hypothetical protein